MTSGFGSIPKGKLRPVIKDGVRRINGRQVELLRRLMLENEWNDYDAIRVIQKCCPGVKIESIEDTVDGPPMQDVVAVLKGEKK